MSTKPQFKTTDVNDKYEIGDKLGSGNYSVVKLATEKETGKKFAAKIIQKKGAGKKGIEMVHAEVTILETVNHKNVVGLNDYFETDTEFYLILELISGGELFDKIVEISSYSEKDASRVVREVVEAIAHIHSKGIVHRDLKPENLLLENSDPNSSIRIADFGLSKFIDPKKPLNVPVGTPGYVAPEVVVCLEDEQGCYGLEIDLWAIGVITYILLCGFPPFYSDDDDEVFDQILAGDFDFPSPQWDDISDSAKDLINKLLVLDPQKRLTAEQTLEHPWVKGSAAPEAPLASALTELKKFNAKRKWKGAILATLMMKSFGNKLKILQANSSFKG